VRSPSFVVSFSHRDYDAVRTCEAVHEAPMDCLKKRIFPKRSGDLTLSDHNDLTMKLQGINNDH
jgi:hypothetical protein